MSAPDSASRQPKIPLRSGRLQMLRKACRISLVGLAGQGLGMNKPASPTYRTTNWRA